MERSELGSRLDVNWNESELQWRYNLSQNRVTHIEFKDCPQYWRSGTGWHLEYDSGCSTGYLSAAEYKVESSRTYDNDIFVCGLTLPLPLKGAKTWVHDHRLIGLGTGYVRYSTTMDKSGDCAWLLYSLTSLTIY